MNKNFTLTLLIAAAMIGFSMSANAQQTSSDFVATNATVITPIVVTGNNPLNFGDIVGTTAGGTITIATDGSRTASVSDLIMTTQTGTVSAAQFTVTGQDGYAYSIALPTAAYPIDNGATGSMNVDTFTSNETGTLTGGSEVVKVGAKLTVGANQEAGSYTSADGLTVTVQYN